jgi:hypothetical protein
MRPQHPPQKQQHVVQHMASSENNAASFKVHQQSMSFSENVADI